MSRALLSFLAGMMVFVAGLEGLFRALPVGTASKSGYHIDPDILGNPPHHRWRVATGWDLRNPQRLRANAQGFVADHDFVPDPQAVALIGDSYVEASMLDAADRPGTQLERMLGGRRAVYAMGTPGTALLDYAQRVRFAADRYGVGTFVLFIETGDVQQSLCGSGNVVSRCLDRATLAPRAQRRPPPSALKALARHSALAQYLISQLGLDGTGLSRLAGEAFTRQTPHMASPPAPARMPDAAETFKAERVADAVAAEFFRVLQPYRAARIVLVFDADRSGLQKGQPASAPARDRFMALARAQGVTVVDMAPVYRRHFAASPLSLSVGPYDGHLNPLGIRLVAREAADALAAAGP